MKLVCLFAFMITLAASKHYILKLKDKKDSKSESEDDQDQLPIGADYDASSCFSPLSKVETPVGYKDMSELVLGDTVATFMEGHGKVFSKFLGWMDKGPQVAYYRQVNSTNGKSFMLTDNHIIFAVVEGKLISKYAKDLKLTDSLLSWTDGKKEITGISSLDYVYSKGYVVPLTEEGTLLVDDILCSCYASFEHSLSHMILSPARLLPYLLDNEKSQHLDGVRTYVKRMKQIGTFFGFRMKDKKSDDVNALSLKDVLSVISPVNQDL